MYNYCFCFLVEFIYFFFGVIQTNRHKTEDAATNSKPSAGLAFVGPYDVTVHNGDSAFADPSYQEAGAIPHYNEVYQPDGHAADTGYETVNNETDAYDFVDSNGAMPQDRQNGSDNNAYCDIDNETNAYNYVDSNPEGGVDHNTHLDENIYEDTSGLEAERTEDQANNDIYAV